MHHHTLCCAIAHNIYAILYLVKESRLLLYLENYQYTMQQILSHVEYQKEPLLHDFAAFKETLAL